MDASVNAAIRISRHRPEFAMKIEVEDQDGGSGACSGPGPAVGGSRLSAVFTAYRYYDG